MRRNVRTQVVAAGARTEVSGARDVENGEVSNEDS
jgi:hypothetical protein